MIEPQILSASRPIPTEIYDARASAIGSDSLKVIAAEFGRLPVAPLAHPLSDLNGLRYEVCVYVVGSVRSAKELGRAVQLVWLSGQFLAASALIRMLIELWGSIAYCEQKVLRKIEQSNLEVAAARSRKLLLGSRTGATFRPDVSADLTVVNVMDFVRAANATAPGTMDEYTFLCEAAHPSYVPHTMLLFAGSTYDNWNNEAFAARMHPVLDRTLKAAESALAGIEKASLDICHRCLPPILEETSLW